MSASLVGSEMCIRDSVYSFPWQDEDATLRTFVDTDFAGCLRTRRSTCGGAVSYTHLTLPTICSV
eukprot:7305829-Alexandrium_andersonii.AAC.1